MKSTNFRTKLVALNSKVTKAVEFAYPPRDEENSSTLGNLGKAAVVGGAAYGAGSLIRGRLMRKPTVGNVPPVGGVAGAISDFKAGHSANVANAKSAFGALKSAVAPKMAAAGSAVGTATNAVADRAGAIATAAKAQAAGIGNLVATKSRLFRGKFAR